MSVRTLLDRATTMRACPICFRNYGEDHRFCPLDGALLGAGDDYLGTTLLGQFRLTEVAGRGASGTVYAATQAPMGRQVAVKILNRELLLDPDMVRRFDREARAVARLSHPNIVTLHGAGLTDDGVPFLVMEYVDGEPLDQVIGKGALPPARALAITRQIAAALTETHSAGIVHRDLKPANVVLVQRRRSADEVKVLDFGVAKIVTSEGEAEASVLTRAGAVWGTPHYLAPEQARGEVVDQRADIYSLGVMLYEMVTGQVPFSGTGVAVLLAHMNRQARPPEQLNGAVGKRLSGLIMSCLAKDRERRLPSAEALIDAIDGLDDVYDDVLDDVLDGDDAFAVTAVALAGIDSGDELVTAKAGRLSGFGLAALLVTALFYLSQWLLGPQPLPPLAEVALETAVAGAGVEEQSADRSERPGTRMVVIAERGYSLRVLVPERMVVGVDYEILIDAWDRDGEAITAAELIVTIDDSSGLSRGVAAKPTDKLGRYRFRRAFERAGTHIMRVFPPAGGAMIQLFYEVVELGGDEVAAVKPGHGIRSTTGLGLARSTG